MPNIIKKGRFSLFILCLIFFIIASFGVTAVGTHLNITILETVTQNVTFAENFDLTESQDYCMINGVINVTNPESDTVYDIYLRFSEIQRLTSDIVWSAGKAGTIYSGGAGVTESITSNIGTNVNNYTLTSDLDNDGNTADYLYHNGTALIFNLSTEGVIYVNLSNSTTEPVDIQNAGTTPVPIEMTQVDIIGSTRTLGNITITGIASQDNLLNISDLTITIYEHYESPIILHIPELRQNNYTTFIYNVSCMGEEPPVNIETVYSSSRHPTIDKKVLAGYNWTINQTAINENPAGIEITNINITMTAEAVSWNDSSFSFGLVQLYGVGDYANTGGNGTSTTSWWWAPNGGSLAFGTNESILYDMQAPYSVPYSLTYLALTESITYNVGYLVSNMTLDEINASAQIDFDFEKRIVQPSDNLNASHNVTWEIRPYVQTPANITYNLNQVTLWVTHDYNPANVTSLTKTYSGSPVQEINITTQWDPTADYWQFNYTDGSSASYPPPIVWMEPEWLIKNAGAQLVNSTTSVNGQDIYMKYIYVVNGYWLQIEKNVTNLAEDQYNISIYVENIGNGWTPEYEKVTVYDYVPDEFAAGQWTLSPDSTNNVGTVSSTYYGTAYVWDIPWKVDMNSSLGPKNGPDATGAANYSWSVSYIVNGSGAYKVTELYIVGLDPLKVDGAFASPIITIISGIKTYSHEIMYIAVVLFLVIINVVNLVMTNRINRKLNQRLPPAPAPKHHNNYGWK